MCVYEKDRRRNKVLFWNLQGRYAILYNILLKLIYEVITMEPIYVTGHKSPDTDSICSSFGMARLKQLQGIDAVPVRAGEINKETAFALDYFGVKPQQLMSDFYVKVEDAVHRNLKPLAEEASLKDAALWFNEHDQHAFAPVVKGNKLVGVLERSALAEEFIKTVTGAELDTVRALVHEPQMTFSVNDNGHDVPETGCYVVVDGADYVGVVSADSVAHAPKKQVFLVDHNEKKQIIDGIDEAQIVGVVDHHRIGGTLATDGPIFIHFRPVGCTATMVTSLYNESGTEIPKEIAGLLLSAIISDTLMFRSPTCTSIDRSAAEKLSEICGVEIEEFAIDMFSAGSDMSSRTPKEIFNQDKKKFQVGDHGFMVSQINSMNAIELEEIKEKLIPYLEEKFDGLGVEMCYVMLTNIVKEDTELLCFGEKAREVILSAFQLPSDMEDIVLKGLVSRKKQLIPSIVTVLQQM